LSEVAGRSPLAEAIRYTLARWEGLIRFLEDGRIERDTNPVERSIRPIALNRKDALFAGSDEVPKTGPCSRPRSSAASYTASIPTPTSPRCRRASSRAISPAASASPRPGLAKPPTDPCRRQPVKPNVNAPRLRPIDLFPGHFALIAEA
jgi:hypothetical protein